MDNQSQEPSSRSKSQFTQKFRLPHREQRPQLDLNALAKQRRKRRIKIYGSLEASAESSQIGSPTARSKEGDHPNQNEPSKFVLQSTDPMAKVYYGGMNVAQSQRDPNMDYLAQQIVEDEKFDSSANLPSSPHIAALRSFGFDLNNDKITDTQKQSMKQLLEQDSEDPTHSEGQIESEIVGAQDYPQNISEFLKHATEQEFSQTHGLLVGYKDEEEEGFDSLVPTPEIMQGGDEGPLNETKMGGSSKIYSKETQLKQGRISKIKSLKNDPKQGSKLKETFEAYDQQLRDVLVISRNQQQQSSTRQPTLQGVSLFQLNLEKAGTDREQQQSTSNQIFIQEGQTTEESPDQPFQVVSRNLFGEEGSKVEMEYSVSKRPDPRSVEPELRNAPDSSTSPQKLEQAFMNPSQTPQSAARKTRRKAANTSAKIENLNSIYQVSPSPNKLYIHHQQQRQFGPKSPALPFEIQLSDQSKIERLKYQTNQDLFNQAGRQQQKEKSMNSVSHQIQKNIDSRQEKIIQKYSTNFKSGFRNHPFEQLPDQLSPEIAIRSPIEAARMSQSSNLKKIQPIDRTSIGRDKRGDSQAKVAGLRKSSRVIQDQLNPEEDRPRARGTGPGVLQKLSELPHLNQMANVSANDGLDDQDEFGGARNLEIKMLKPRVESLNRTHQKTNSQLGGDFANFFYQDPAESERLDERNLQQDTAIYERSRKHQQRRLGSLVDRMNTESNISSRHHPSSTSVVESVIPKSTRRVGKKGSRAIETSRAGGGFIGEKTSATPAAKEKIYLQYNAQLDRQLKQLMQKTVTSSMKPKPSRVHLKKKKKLGLGTPMADTQMIKNTSQSFVMEEGMPQSEFGGVTSRREDPKPAGLATTGMSQRHSDRDSQEEEEKQEELNNFSVVTKSLHTQTIISDRAKPFDLNVAEPPRISQIETKPGDKRRANSSKNSNSRHKSSFSVDRSTPTKSLKQESFGPEEPLIDKNIVHEQMVNQRVSSLSRTHHSRLQDIEETKEAKKSVFGNPYKQPLIPPPRRQAKQPVEGEKWNASTEAPAALNKPIPLNKIKFSSNPEAKKIKEQQSKPHHANRSPDLPPASSNKLVSPKLPSAGRGQSLTTAYVSKQLSPRLTNQMILDKQPFRLQQVTKPKSPKGSRGHFNSAQRQLSSRADQLSLEDSQNFPDKLLSQDSENSRFRGGDDHASIGTNEKRELKKSQFATQSQAEGNPGVERVVVTQVTTAKTKLPSIKVLDEESIRPDEQEESKSRSQYRSPDSKKSRIIAPLSPLAESNLKQLDEISKSANTNNTYHETNLSMRISAHEGSSKANETDQISILRSDGQQVQATQEQYQEGKIPSIYSKKAARKLKRRISSHRQVLNTLNQIQKSDMQDVIEEGKEENGNGGDSDEQKQAENKQASAQKPKPKPPKPKKYESFREQKSPRAHKDLKVHISGPGTNSAVSGASSIHQIASGGGTSGGQFSHKRKMDKFSQILNFGASLEKDFADAQNNLNNYKELIKKKQKLDKRHQIFYGGASKDIFPDMDKLEKLGPLQEQKKVPKGVKFAEDVDLVSPVGEISSQSSEDLSSGEDSN